MGWMNPNPLLGPDGAMPPIAAAPASAASAVLPLTERTPIMRGSLDARIRCCCIIICCCCCCIIICICGTKRDKSGVERSGMGEARCHKKYSIRSHNRDHEK